MSNTNDTGRSSGNRISFSQPQVTSRSETIPASQLPSTLEDDLIAILDMLEGGDSAKSVATLFDLSTHVVQRLRRTVKQPSKASAKAKITQAIADKIRERTRDGESQSDMAREFGIRPCTVSNIVAGRTWRGGAPLPKPQKAKGIFGK